MPEIFIDAVNKKNKNINRNMMPTELKSAYGAAFFHGESWYKCPYCNNWSFEYFDAIFGRIDSIKYDNGTTYICEKCKQEFLLPK